MSLKQLSIKELAAISGGCEANCHHRMDGAKTETERHQILEYHLGFCLFG